MERLWDYIEAPSNLSDAIAHWPRKRRKASSDSCRWNRFTCSDAQRRQCAARLLMLKAWKKQSADIGDEIYIGSAIPSAQLYENEELKNLLPGLIEASDLIGSTQIQGRATMGGNLCNSSPAGDSIPAMIAVGAVCDIAGVSGSRELPVEDFVTGVGTNALSDGELLLGLKIKKPASNRGRLFAFYPRTEMDIAVAGCGVSVTMDGNQCVEARVAIGAVAPTALLVPDGHCC